MLRALLHRLWNRLTKPPVTACCGSGRTVHWASFR